MKGRVCLARNLKARGKVPAPKPERLRMQVVERQCRRRPPDGFEGFQIPVAMPVARPMQELLCP